MESALEERVSVGNLFLSDSPMPILPLISSNASQQLVWYFSFMAVPSLGAANGNDPRPSPQPTLRSEFYAASEGSRDAIWFKALLAELGINVGRITMYCDNVSARSFIEDPDNHRGSKHIAVHYFFVRDQQELETIKMAKVSSHDNVADMFTKALPKRAFQRHRNGIEIREVKQ